MKKIYFLVLALTGGVLVSSCGIYNRYDAKEEVRSDLYGEGAAVGQSGESLAMLDWRELFTDKQLQQLIDTALVKNADLRKAKLQVEAAEAMVKSARLSYLPSFALAPQGTFTYTEVNSATATTYNLPLSASWEIDIFGKNTNQKRSAVMALEQSKEYAQAVRCRVIASVANLYYTLVTLDEQLAISLQSAEYWEKSLAITKDIMEAGLTTDVAVAQTEAALYSVRSSVEDLKQQIKLTENAFSLLLFDVPGSIGRGSSGMEDSPELLKIGLPVELLSNRPDVRMAEAAFAKAFYQTNAARSAFYPSIILSGSAGWTNQVGDVIVNPAKFVLNALGSLTQPLFSQGKIAAQYKASKAAQEQALIDFEYSLLNAGKEVNDALSGYQTAEAKSIELQEQVKSLNRAVESTSLMVDYGHLTYLEVITAQQSYLAARLNEAANRLVKAQSVISLYNALGGGR
ncbi:MAG: TolC family protein [Bacteroidales bacterium]|nr:TolC family protein [Bacteroidales bacterium]